MTSPTTVYTAKKIVTMNRSQPEATAVAVRDGIILAVGSFDDVRPWLRGEQYNVVRDFKGRCSCRG